MDNFDSRNKLKVKGVPIHDGLLYLLTGVLIYLPIGIAMRFLVEGTNDEWYMVYLMSAYLGGFLLYLVFATLFYRVSTYTLYSIPIHLTSLS